MPDNPSTPSAIDRRRLFRGGALLAGAAGLTAVGTAVGSPTASADLLDPVKLGGVNVAEGSTTLSVGSGAEPVLVLENSSGPALSLKPVGNDWDGVLDVGEMASTSVGPIVGVDFGDGVQSLFLATSRILDKVPVTYSIKPVRLVDTRWKTRPPAIVRTSPDALDSKQRLRAGAWMDVGVAPTGEGFVYSSVFANVVATASVKKGYLAVYAPGPYPGTSTLNFGTGQTVSNGSFTSVDESEGYYALRIWASTTTHVVLDITGVIVTPDNSRTPVAAMNAEAAHEDSVSRRRLNEVTKTLASRGR